MQTHFVTRDSFGMDSHRGTGPGLEWTGELGDKRFAVPWAATTTDTVDKLGNAWAPS